MSQKIEFFAHNSTNKDSALPLDPRSTEFKLHTLPGTDLWRKPPVESNNAPSVTTRIKTSSFKSARVTVTAEWTRLYDQGGLVLIWPRAGEELGSAQPPTAWVKTGIEYHDEQSNLSTVATPATSTSDWSLLPLSSTSVTVEIEREQKPGGNNTSLWVYLVDHNQRRAVREITWVFSPDRLDDILHVGLYVARPTKLEGDNKENLTVHFTDFQINYN